MLSITTTGNMDYILQAVNVWREGGLVAFPTETVYGLGADAENDQAVAKIFAVKGRPSFNPLIVHVADRAMAERYGRFTPAAQALAEAFWPGPLTLVMARQPECRVSLLASAGLETVALRLPSHPLAAALLAAFGQGIAAPSANRSGRISPTMAAHVAAEFAHGPAPDLLLDGGACRVGLESTVVDVTDDAPLLLRPGSVTLAALQAVWPSVSPYEGGGIKAPGMLGSHYAPSLPIRLHADRAEKGEALLAFGAAPAHEGAMLNLSESGDLTEAAAHLFAYLRALDRPAYSGIAVMSIPMEGIGTAINDRLRRAAAPRS